MAALSSFELKKMHTICSNPSISKTAQKHVFIFSQLNALRILKNVPISAIEKFDAIIAELKIQFSTDQRRLSIAMEFENFRLCTRTPSYVRYLFAQFVYYVLNYFFLIFADDQTEYGLISHCFQGRHLFDNFIC